MKRGFFITFEGPEGSGKSTHAALLARVLRRAGRKVVLTREPGGSPLAEAIRKILLNPRFHPDPRTELLLYLAARRDHVEKTIHPALKRGAVVICDRFSDATAAYQGYGRGFALGLVERLDSWARGGVTPDLTVLMDLPVNQGLRKARSRNGSRGGDRMERESRGFHERVRRGYLALARRFPRRIRVVRLRKNKKETFEEIMNVLHTFSTLTPALSRVAGEGRQGR